MVRRWVGSTAGDPSSGDGGWSEGVTLSEVRTNMTEFADLARALGAAGEESDRLMLAVEAAVELIPGCLHAGITINRGGECHTLAATGEVLSAVNVLQNELGEGPCHAPDREEEVVEINDLLGDERRGPGMRRVALDDHRAAGGQRTRRVAARGAEGEREVRGAEDRDRAERADRAAEVGARWRGRRVGRVEDRVEVVAALDRSPDLSDTRPGSVPAGSHSTEWRAPPTSGRRREGARS